MDSDDSDSIISDWNATIFTIDTSCDSSFNSPSVYCSDGDSTQTDPCSNSTNTPSDMEQNDDVYSVSESSVDGSSENSYRISIVSSSTSDDRNELFDFSDSFNSLDLEDILERAMATVCAEREITERFRERSWSLEECTVCRDVMLRNQELEMLPCGHQFHASCIRPWLEERTTCPNCRKNA